ncbi:MAG: hypothetical protein H7Y42_04505 [Chitinophagaceae bacterium]|nr:hypothetical protein [Chitinophagaceae bacterium]
MLPSSNIPIPLDPSFLLRHSREQTEIELRRIVCSVKFELLEKENAVRLLGPEMSYHEADPYLHKRLGEMLLEPREILTYTSRAERIDICFEDSWTGYFIAELLDECNELTIIHLDDHTDLMATLLCVSDNVLVDPTSGALFDPMCSGSWRSAIHSGALNIGNYLTPLYYSGSSIHIRHLNNVSGRGAFSWIVREPCHYDLLPGRKFAAIAKVDSPGPNVVGSYYVSSDPDTLFITEPSARVIIHIDLDYFINDFNGASCGAAYVPDVSLRDNAINKLQRFFDALINSNIEVARWIIATSPGFCSAYHWEWLLKQLEQRIAAYDHRETRGIIKI